VHPLDRVKKLQSRPLTLIFAVTVALAGCATPSGPALETPPPAPSVARAPAQVPAPGSGNRVKAALDPAIAERILSLDPEHLSADDVRTLAAGPAPRIVLLHGGIYPVHLLMTSFGGFLTGMGYPEARIRDPADREWSYSPYEDSTKLAGMLAWQYEHDSMRPMMIGHSQGGMQAVKVLRELAGMMSPSIPVWNPVTRAAESRTTIVDPLTGQERPVVGVKVAYASAVGAGGAAFLLPNQWIMMGKLRSIPDSVEEFTGFNIGLDLIAWTVPGDDDSRWRENGTASVRNVELPATYNHITVPITSQLPRDPETRAWIEAYTPGTNADPSALPGDASLHVLWAADVWYSIKKHWCLESQRLIRAERKAPG
jgi:hypothetical protein